MSGGSWDYFCYRLDEVAARLSGEKCPVRQAFGDHLKLCAEALKAVEWVDSGDSGIGDEIPCIEKVLGKDGPVLILGKVRQQAEEVLERLKVAMSAAN